MYLYLSSVSKF